MTATIVVQDSSTQFKTDRSYPGLWTITFDNPPINMFVPATVVELGALMSELEAGPVREGDCVPVGESRFFRRPSRCSQGSRKARDAESLA